MSSSDWCVAPSSPHRDPGVGRADLDVEARVADGVADLVVAPPGAEHGEAGREGDPAREGEPRGHADHVLLGDAHVDQAVGIGLPEVGGLGRARQVGVDGDDVEALPYELGERLAVCLARSPIVHR
jgi:hypothetical protein